MLLAGRISVYPHHTVRMLCGNLTPILAPKLPPLRGTAAYAAVLRGWGKERPGEGGPADQAADPRLGGERVYSESFGWGSTTFQKRQPFTELPVMALAAALRER